MKKEVIVILFFIFGVVISINVFADEFGCCSNPGAGNLAICLPDNQAQVSRDTKCCPPQYQDPQFAQYYKSVQNPNNPLNYQDCITNFFRANTACSLVSACASGCCCSDTGGEQKLEAQCRGTGQTFRRGETNCGQICPPPRCPYGMDASGNCLAQETSCNDANHIPKLINLEITPAEGQKKFSLTWGDECSENSAYYEVLRCKESGCTNFQLIGIINTASFEDASGDLLFDATYTYQVRAHYSLQTAVPMITKTAFLGDGECSGRNSNSFFCLNNTPFFCLSNKLVNGGARCPQSQICAVSNNIPLCVSRGNCINDTTNLFGLFSTKEKCENDNDKPKYCFYDRSHSTVDSCFSCDPSMACYDYKTQAACARDNCKAGNCKWKGLSTETEIGACISTAQYNCQWCNKKGTKTLENLRAFNEVFDFCTERKSDILSEGKFNCYFKKPKSMKCSDVTCTDYSQEQCRDTTITHDANNMILNPSNDRCGIKVCQNINNVCVKNADGDNSADCITNAAACEKDYFPPNTTITPGIQKGRVTNLNIQIFDKTNSNSSAFTRTSSDYSTFFCTSDCSKGHPFNASISSRSVVISNLNAYDGRSGKFLFTLNEGKNVVKYYSQDPSKNIEEVKSIIIEVYGNFDGPAVIIDSFNVSDASRILDKYYTSNQKPTISMRFFEPANVTFARLVYNKTGLAVSFPLASDLSNTARFVVPNTLSNGAYTFELNAKNKNSIYMNSTFSRTIIIDNNKPTLNITPANNSIFNTSVVDVRLALDKESALESVKINSEDMANSFSTIDNKIFTATLNLADGNKNLKVTARDFAGNRVAGSTFFIVDAYPLIINLAEPKFGVSSTYIFNIAVETDNNAFCKYSLGPSLEFSLMENFQNTGGTLHTLTDFNKIPSGDSRIYKFNVGCDDNRRGKSFKTFDISVDTTPPLLKSAFAFPNPVIESPPITALTVESDEPVVCKFSVTFQEFDRMEGKFESFDNNTFKTINKQSITLEKEGDFSYYAACKNKARLISQPKEIKFKVDMSIPLKIDSNTPEYFNSTNVILAIATNKKTQCQFSETDETARSGEPFGASSYSHTRALISTPGKHTFFVVCRDIINSQVKYSDVLPVAFTIDVTPPIILLVNDSSTLPDKPQFTWNTDSLRVRWNSIDNESRVSSHLYSLVESGTSNIFVNWTTSYVNNEWMLVTNFNGTNSFGLGLTNGNRYFFRVKARNIVGLSSNISESSGVTVDTSLKPLNCTNGIKDEKETDVDCGGICNPCNLNSKCAANIDCKSGFCSNGICAVPKCDDSVRNHDESDVDCGGSCSKCQNNKVCNNNNDCESNYCSFGFCKAQESCADSKLSPGEADVDCGGACPTKCPEAKHCDRSEDCESGLQCVSSACKKCLENDKNCNGIPDDQEVTAIKDTDGDGIPDEWEIKNGLNPNDPKDAGLDNDKDGLTNLEEYKHNTNPNLADTDGDGATDKEEIDARTNPLDPKDFPKSNKTKIILFIFGGIILVSGFGYLGYRLISKRKEEKFFMPAQRGVQGQMPKSQAKQIQLKQKAEDIQIKEALKRKEYEKEKERRKLFAAFGKGEAKGAGIRQAAEKKEESEDKLEIKKPKGDVIAKLKEIARETRKRKQQIKK